MRSPRAHRHLRFLSSWSGTSWSGALAALLAVAALSACEDSAQARAGAAAQSAAGAQPPAAAAPAAPAAPVRREPLLPRFEGKTLDGETVTSDLFKNRRGLIVGFSSSDPDANALADLVHGLAEASAKDNVAFLGVSRDQDPSAAQAFAKHKGLAFPILDDRSGSISQMLRLGGGNTGIVLVDGDGYMVASFLGIEKDLGPSFYDDALRTQLRLPAAHAMLNVELGVHPKAPDFEVRGLDDKPLTLASLDGKVVLVIFFLDTCPHCHEMLRMLNQLRKDVPNEDFAIVPISVRDRIYNLEEMVKTLDIQLAVYRDPKDTVRNSYAANGGVPDVLVLDRQHRVVTRQHGDNPRIESVVKMAVRQALGVANPILLVKSGYSGSEACSVCHEQAHDTWALTQHAYAFDTLVKHGEERNPECLPCHTVGFNQEGGYTVAQAALDDYLEGVQCENCHGRGGPHQSPEFAKQGMEAACKTCHTAEHSLHFNFAERLPLISHAANANVAKLDTAQRRALLEQREKRQKTMFDTAAYVGSASCAAAGCHPKEHELWAKSPHANAFASLAAKGAASNADCQKCHTTGFGQSGGFPAAGDAQKGVGCESCHGPAGNHIAPDAPKKGTILRLTEKCDSCVILQICGTCHDEKNDPKFEYNLEDKLALIKHGFRAKGGATAE